MPSFSITDSRHSRNCKSGEGQKNSTAEEGDEKELSIICLIALPNCIHFPVTWLLMRNEAQKGGSTAPMPCHLWPAYFGYNNKMTFLLVLVSTEISTLVHGVFSIVPC